MGATTSVWHIALMGEIWPCMCRPSHNDSSVLQRLKNSEASRNFYKIKKNANHLSAPIWLKWFTIFMIFFFQEYLLRIGVHLLPFCKKRVFVHYDIQQVVEIGLLSRVMCKLLFFGSYCWHHTRRKNSNFFPAPYNILFFFFFWNLRYLIKLLKCFFDGI